MITEYQFKMLEKAYNFYNKRLFEGKLTPVLVNFQKARGRVAGTYCHITYNRKDTAERIPEIELNPSHFKGNKDEKILAVLVHEMAHHWQQLFGKPSGKWHNKEWGDKMQEIGLMPSSTGKKGGAKTGISMSHYAIGGGRFEYHTKYFLKKYGKVFLVETSTEYEISKAAAASKDSKTKYTCPKCGQNAWAKPGANLICGFDMAQMKS